MVIDSDGIVVTNHHVVAGSTEVTVTVPATDKTYSAEVLGYDATTDVAILQLDGASGLTTVTTDLAAVSVGATVTSVGNAQGGGELIAAPGTVTALGQNITVNEDNGTTADLTDLIQVNAAMVPGDSGGAMLDAEGEVIGMNVAGSTNTSDQVGYAIPITSVMTIADSVLKGVSTQSITLGRTGFLGVQMTTGTDVTVAGLISGSPAVAAGLTVGSVITAVDNTPIAARADLTAILASHQPGDQVAVAWTDMGGATHTETITLAEAPLA
jgi:S1-C subfamily serine protease